MAGVVSARQRIMRDIRSCADTKNGRTVEALADRIVASVEPHTLTGHADAAAVPGDGAVVDAEGILLQRSPDGTAWFQPGYDHEIATEDITLPAIVIHPWGWRP